MNFRLHNFYLAKSFSCVRCLDHAVPTGRIGPYVDLDACDGITESHHCQPCVDAQLDPATPKCSAHGIALYEGECWVCDRRATQKRFGRRTA